MTAQTRRTAGIILGALALLVGLLWIGQGLGYVGGSAMSGAMQWFWIGLVLAVVGVVLLARGLRRTAPR